MMNKEPLAYVIYWNSDRFKNLDWDDDALFEPPEDRYYNTIFSDIDELNLPEKLYFRAFFPTLKKSDYPANDVFWPIMSKRMYDIVVSFGDFPHRTYSCVMVDITDPEGGNWDGKSNPDPKYCNYDYVAVQITEYEDIFDFERSEYEPHFLNPEEVGTVMKLVLKEPSAGLPHIFRLKEQRRDLFIRPEVKKAFDETGLKGILYGKYFQ